MATVYETLERPLIPVLAAMERRGIMVDPAVLRGLSRALAQRMAALESEIRALAGGDFNIGSPKQLGEILFARMGRSGERRVGNERDSPCRSRLPPDPYTTPVITIFP